MAGRDVVVTITRLGSPWINIPAGGNYRAGKFKKKDYSSLRYTVEPDSRFSHNLSSEFEAFPELPTTLME